MTSLFLLSLFLIGAADAPSDDVWTLRGTVKDPGNTPLVGAVVMVVGTSLGAMTNQNGEYLISNIPIDKLSCQARMVGMGERTIEVLASAGDTAEVHFYLPVDPYNPLETPVITIDQQLVETVFTDTLEIVLSNWHELDMKHSQCWGRGELLPSWQGNDSTVCALLPRNTDSLHISVFPGREICIAVPDGLNRLNTKIPMDPPAESIRNLYRPKQEYEFIDLARWGDSRYQNWGLLGTEMIYTDHDQPEMLLVYHEQAVLIKGSGELRTVEFPFPTLKYTCDPELKYLLIWDIYGQNGTSGDVALVNLENGNSTIFDPTPDIDEPQGHYTSNCCTVVVNTFPGVRHHVTSSGKVVVVEEEFFRIFDSTGSLVCNVAMEEIGIEHFYYTHQFLSMGQNALSAVFSDGTGNYCLTIDLHGNVLNLSPLPLPSLDRYRSRSAAVDHESAILWGSIHRNGVARIDCLSGDCIYRPGLRTNGFFTSSDHKLLGIKIFSNTNPGYSVLETWDMDTGERYSSLQEAYTDPDPVLARITSITNDGNFLGVTYTQLDGEEGKYAFIMNSDGEVIWKSPPLVVGALRNPYRTTVRESSNPPAPLSPGGSIMTLPNGRYIILIHFGEEELPQ